MSWFANFGRESSYKRLELRDFVLSRVLFFSSVCFLWRREGGIHAARGRGAALAHVALKGLPTLAVA